MTVSRVSTDTRGPLRRGDLFVGLVGERFDGGAFASTALRRGASVVLVRKGTSVALDVGGAVVEVDDPLAALQALAAAERDAFAGEVLAITGSNGKTCVKEMLVAVLGTSRRVYASPMSYNSQVGVALTLVGLDPTADIALVECGISRPGEMERLAAFVRPTCGVFVNVGDAHLAGFGTKKVTAREKAQLFAGLKEANGWCVVPHEETLAREALDAIGPMVSVVGTDAGVTALGLPAAFEQDARLAVAAGERLGVPRGRALEVLQGWQAPPMRLEISRTARGVVVINDSYTADPVSMDAALATLSRQPVPGRRVAVLGGMAQLGAASAQAHEEVGRRMGAVGVDILIGVGDGGAEIVAAARAAGHPESLAVPDASAASIALEETLRSGDAVLIKASRPVGLERIAPRLLGAVEPARATVDEDRLVANLRAIERSVGPDVAVMCVVKSFGYGLDAIRTADALARAGAAYFDVAIAEEGVALRDAGITAPILVQHVVPEDADRVVAHGLTALVGSETQLSSVARAAARAQRAVRVHIKVDTGMSRAGLPRDEAVALAVRAAGTEWVSVEGVMTHFSASDEPMHDAFTASQIAVFREAVDGMAALGVRPQFVHACNSAAIARFPDAHFSMVRAGLGLLGYTHVDGAPMLGTRPVLRLTTRVVSAKWVEAGTPVGYGLSWTAGRRTRVAVVALGYGDGYPRALSNRGEMGVGGVLCPVIGRVCMDVTMLDVTDAPDVQAGDEVVVFGDGAGEPDLCEQAARADTIAYEVLARLSGRVRRILRRTR